MTASHSAARVLPLLAILASPWAQAAEFKAGDWDLNLGGFVNANLTTVKCTGNQGITGAALAGQALGCGGADARTTIGNGLLPNALIASGKTKQNGLDLGVTLMMGVHTATDSAIGANSGIDTRQAFFTIGSEAGTFKLGRDYGSFGANAILSDMTLLGAGAPVQGTQRGRVSLGHIGAGYTYLGHYGQMSYASPDMGGFSFNGGLYSPVGNGGTAQAGRQPQVQLGVNLKMGDAKLWGGVKSQKFEDATNGNFTMNGVEVGGAMKFGPVDLLANIQSGKGLGVLADGDAGNAKQTNAFVQATYGLTDTLKAGLGYGQTRLKDGAGLALKSNDNATLGAYYKLTPAITLNGELSQTTSKPFAGESAKMRGVSFGGILFF